MKDEGWNDQFSTQAPQMQSFVMTLHTVHKDVKCIHRNVKHVK